MMELLLFLVPGIVAYEFSVLWRRHRRDGLSRLSGYLVFGTILCALVEESSPRYYYHRPELSSLWIVLPYALLLGLLWLLVRDGLVPMLGRIGRDPVARMGRRMLDPNLAGLRLTVHTADGSQICGRIAASEERGVVVQDEEEGLVMIPAAQIRKITT